MGKQTRSKKPENFGKGKVTPVQVAFIVDRYLSDNTFSQTRSVFRSEASALISRSPVQEAPKSLLSLGAMLDEYICLKEQKVLMEQERARLEQEKSRVQMLLQGMQGVMNAYNAGASTVAPAVPAAAARAATAAPPPDHFSGSSTGCLVYNTPTALPVSVPSNKSIEPANFCTPMSNQPSTSKRKDINSTETQQAAKKSRTKPPSKKFLSKGNDAISQSNNATNGQNEDLDPHCSVNPSPYIHGTSGSPIQGSSVAKCLFNKSLSSPPSNSSSPKTPPQAISPQSEKPNSPLENITPREITPNHCTVISSERLTVSPTKHITYTVERSHSISTSPAKATLKRSSKRDHVKGRLDFDGSDELMGSDKLISERTSTSESDQGLDIYDMDLPDLFGADFSFSELLVDLDLGGEGIGYSCDPTFSTDNISGSSHESGDCNLGTDQVTSEFSSTLKVISEDNNLQGPETTTTMKSITKCIRIVSPTKKST